MDLSLPPSLLSSPMPLVSLLGLESLSSPTLSSSLFDLFACNRGGDRVALRFRRDDDEGASFPLMKPARSNYDWFIPKGVLKRNWMEKHLLLLPSVAVVIVELEWNDDEWTTRKRELVNKVQRIRDALSNRATKIVVVLLQCQPSSMVLNEDITTSERASALCSACELSARSLFVLPFKADNVDKYVVRLENAFYELAQNYYHQEIRGVKAHRDCLTKTTHLYLFVRHQYKAGFLNELKRDDHAAYKHYCQAYSLLMEVRASDTNIMEVKTVAGFISYKICRLAFRLNLPRDAISQFRRHMDIFQHKVGLDALAFEHKGWQSKQCEYFADVFNDAIKEGLAAIQTQHPGLYYQQAAQYAIVRRELCAELCSEANQPLHNEPNPLVPVQPLEFFGQRPWRPGKVSLEPPDMELENSGIQALLYHERTQIDHSDGIITLLNKAIEQFKLFKSPRSQSHLTVTMAEELISSGRLRDALDLLMPVMRHYRLERWRSLLDAVLMLGLKSAFLLGDLALLLQLSLDLCSRESLVDNCVKRRIEENLVALLDESGAKCPLHHTFDVQGNDDNTSTSIKEGSKIWREKLDALSQDQVIVVDLGSSCSSLSARVHFVKQSCQVDEDIVMQVCLRNDNDFDIRITEVGTCLTSAQTCHVKTTETVLLMSKSVQVLSLSFRPTSSDVGQLIDAKRVELLLGNNNLNLKFLLTVPSEKELEERRARNKFIVVGKCQRDKGIFEESKSDFDDFQWRPQVRVVQKEPKVRLELNHSEPALVNEWYTINVSLRNGELNEVHEVSIKASVVEANDPTIADTTIFSFDPSNKETENTNVAEYNLNTPFDSGASKSIQLFVHTSTVGQRDLYVSCSYSVSVSSADADQECQCVLQRTLNLITIEAFELNLKVMSLRMQPITAVNVDEPFLVKTQLKSMSPHMIEIEESGIDTKSPLRAFPRQTEPSKAVTSGCRVSQGSCVDELFCLVVKQCELERTRQDLVDFIIGRYHLKYKRLDSEESNSNASVESSFELGSVHLNSSSIYVQTHLAPFGVVRTPLSLSLTIHNRTNRLHEFALSVEPSEAFMLSGCKQHHFKIVPRKQHKLTFILYPLIAGTDVNLPVIKVQSSRPAHAQDAASIMQRLMPRTMTILPKARDLESHVVGQVSDHVVQANVLECNYKHVLMEPQYGAGVKVVKNASKA